jgi:hypothetical protein
MAMDRSRWVHFSSAKEEKRREKRREKREERERVNS